MAGTVESSSKARILVIIFLSFFLFLSYAFVVFLNSKGFDNTIENLKFKDNTNYFFNISFITHLYVGFSIICFLLITWFFYRQYIKLQNMIKSGKETEKILARKSGNDEIITRFARSVLLSGSMDEAALYAKEAVEQITGGEYFLAGFIDKNDGSLNLYSGSIKSEKILGETAVKKKIFDSYGIWGKALKTRRSLYLNTAQGENSFIPGRNGDYTASAIIAVPAVVKDETVGLIAAAGNDISFTQSDQKDLERIAGLYAVSIQKDHAFLKVMERENQFRVAFKTNPDAVLITGFPDGTIVDVNDGFLNITGYSYSEVIDNSTFDLCLWADLANRDELIAAINERDKIVNYEMQFRLKSGELLTGLISASKIYLNGKPHMLSIVREIEKLKQTENELRKERAFLSKVVETSPAGIIAVEGSSGRILYANQRTSDILGLDINEIKNRSFYDPKWAIRDFNFNELDPSEYIFNLVRSEKRILTDIRHTLIDGNGKRIYLSFNAAPVLGDDGEVEMFVTSLEDVSQEVKTRESLKEAEERLNSVIGSLPVVLWSVNKKGIITLCRGMGLKPLGVAPDALVGQSVFQTFEKEPQFAEIIEDGLKFRPFTKIIKFRKRYYEVTVSPLHDSLGNPSGVSGVATDISRRVKMEEEQAILSSAIEQAAESIVITDNEGHIIYVNPAFENISGYTKEEVLGKNPNILKSGFQGKYFYKDMWKYLLNGKTWDGYLKNKAKDGSYFEEEASISPVFDRTGTIQNFVAVKRDVTQEKIMENQLRKAQKLEAIGTLAGGIAHDFNNILFPIIGFTELLSNKKTDNISEDSRYLENILSAAYRAKELVHQILTFSRQNEEEKRPVKIHVIVKEALKLLRASIPSIIEINPELEQSDHAVIADPTKIHQLVMNLGTNAYQAMEPKGGILGITLKVVEIDKDEKCMGISENIIPGKYIKFTVSDTGSGIPDHILERIFDPYFTTKPQGKGTGLGLATVHGIVQSSGGYIKVYSEENVGSSFNVFFPVAADTDYFSKHQVSTEIVGGNEHILVVDDEELIVEVISDMLKDLGYKTTVRTSSVEALEVFRAKPDLFDLIVTDHTMPNMTGVALAREVHCIKPDMPVVICSGFSEIAAGGKSRISGISDFIMKPVLKTDLAFSVRDALDKKDEHA
ncbi:MAG: PAS domain S-box protein [Thermodesulfobacteriota bacterium]